MTKRIKSDQLADYTELDELDKTILTLKLEYPALTDTKIAKLIGTTRIAVRRHMNKPAWQKAFDAHNAPARSVFDDKAIAKIARDYLALCKSKNEVVRERALRAVLISRGILLRDGPKSTDDNFQPVIIISPRKEKMIVAARTETEARKLIESGEVE